MAFTFQINEGIEFQQNEILLGIAQKNKPKLRFKDIYPIAIRNKNALHFDPDLSILNKETYKKEESMVLDFGDHHVGHFSIQVDSVGSQMDAPLSLKIKFAETIDELQKKAEEYNGWLSSSWIAEELIHLDVLPVSLKLPRRYSFRYVEITVLDTSPKWKASFSQPKLVAESAVLNTTVATIKTDNELLRTIDKISLKTLMDCMQDVFEDGPKRDRRLWIGDLRLQALTNYMTYDHLTLVKRCLYLFAGLTTTEGKISANIFTNGRVAPDDTFLFDYSLFFISCLKDYFKQTSDVQVLKELFPIAKKQIDLALKYVDQEGILNLPDDWPVFIDWSADKNKDTAAQAILIYTLKQLIEMGDYLGLECISFYQEQCERLISAIEEKLYNPESKLFVSGKAREENIFSQVWIILADILDCKKKRELMQRTIDSFFPIRNIATPYMYHHIAEALFQTGFREQGIELILNYWGGMVKLGADTFWEAFKPDDPEYSPYGNPLVNSYCHAWSCTPAYLFRKYDVK